MSANLACSQLCSSGGSVQAGAGFASPPTICFWSKLVLGCGKTVLSSPVVDADLNYLDLGINGILWLSIVDATPFLPIYGRANDLRVRGRGWHP